MKKIIILSLILSSVSWAQKNDAKPGNKKTYTEEDFIKTVNEEVKKKVDTIKTKSVSDITKELLDKEEQLKLRELELQKEHDSLTASQSDLAKKYMEFEARQKSFIGCVDKNEEDSRARIGQLVEMISNMKPQKAAEVLSVQESDIAVKILQMIDAKKASKIFNFMDKDISAKLQKQYLLLKK